MNFVKKSLKYPQVSISVLLLTFIIGGYSLLEMPRREDAKIRVRVGQIIAFYPGANSLQVEEQVTKKLEQYLFQYEEVRKEKTTSTTRDGIVIINVWLNNNVENLDIFWSKLNHQLIVQKAVSLPPGVQGPIVNFEFGDTEALMVAIQMDNPDYSQLRDYAQKLEDGLRTIKAVSKIKRIGEQKEEIIISSNSSKLQQYGMSFATALMVLQSQNTIGPAGNLKTSESQINLYTQGYYKTEAEIADQIIGLAKTGEVVRLKDVANIKRQYQDPASKVQVNGRSAMLLAVQMHDGYNIVEFGKEVDRQLSNTAKLLPAGVKLTTIVNQPAMVAKNVGHFIREFFLAIVAVILIILLLMPLRVAVVAATAIPMTVAMTFAIMHALGIELHQVSLAALIVVLGMVVDDAVVVADNYVELLDKGVDRDTAAWRSATELIVPILTATATIIAAFMPMVFLSGMVREFIIALPLTVSIALASSFIVAMILTPILCFTFIRKGINDSSAKISADKKKSTLLDFMQLGYNKAITWCMTHSKVTILFCLAAIPLAAILYQAVPQKFFPEAERNQFIVELWMPVGTKLEKTEHAVLKIQNLFKNDKRVVSYAAFIGAGAPRFYYNFIPEPPGSNFAQILVNTHKDEEAKQLQNELNARASLEVPEGQVQAKLMQQGTPAAASVEIRIVGDDITTLKSIGIRVKDILQKTRATAFIRSDFKEDYYGVAIRLKDNAARLGFTTESIAKSIYAGFTGATVSTLHEGNKPVDIILRLDEQSRSNLDNLQNMYLPSPMTGASVPLRQIASLEPQWHNGQIRHLNGLRTLTIQCEPANGFLPSQVLKRAGTQLSGIILPAGYKIEYGGEYENQKETFFEMLVALTISLMFIFLILMFQFRNLKETFIVMLTIPLSMFGALLGLLITGNPFGFTAFVGLISLSGIVVRNAIILLDYANELVADGASITSAALESGQRRLRPIFLTASAAAIGVIPMIVSGSPLWSPLASVIAVGIMLAMIISLFLVPVLYAYMIKPLDKNRELPDVITKDTKAGYHAYLAVLFVIALILFSPTAEARENSEKLSLQKVINLAVQNNRLLSIKQLQFYEKQQKVNEDRVKYFPQVIVAGAYQYHSKLGNVTIQEGSLGQASLGPINTPLPANDTKLEMGGADVYSAGVMVYQPISQIPKIMAGVNVAKTDMEIAKIEQIKATLQVQQTAEKLYFGLLIMQKQKEEAEIKLELAKRKLYDVESAVLAGKTTTSSQTGLKANMADEEQNILKINFQIDDYSSDLKRLIGFSSTSAFLLEPLSVDDFEFVTLPIDALELKAQKGNPDLQIAHLYKTKAEYAIDASRRSYLPDFGILGGYIYQDGNAHHQPRDNTNIEFAPRWNIEDAFIGVTIKWNVQDLFSNTYVKRQRYSMKKQAEENLANTMEQLTADIAKAQRKIIQSAELISVARKAVDYRREDFKIQNDRLHAGLNLETDYLFAKAALVKSEADLFAAQLNYRIVVTDLHILIGQF